MTDLNRGLSEVPGLIAERKRYEAWLEALDLRRATTPGHVFERVQADYKARLQRVAEQLASHRHAIEEERQSVVSRLSLLEAEEQMRRDERAELELRSHVGELEGEEAVSAFGTVDEAIAHLVNEKGGLQTRISELESLLEPAAAAAESIKAVSTASEPPPSEPRTSAEISLVAQIEAPTAPADASAPEPTVPETQAAAQESAPAEPVEAPSRRASGELVIPPTAEHAVFVPPEKGRPSGAIAAPAPKESDSEQSFRASDGLRTPSGTFDELKFLDTVVGKGPTKPRGPRASEISPLIGVEGAAREAMSVPPLAANVPGNTPIVLRPSVTLDQSKTLKCSECGAVNYPTEWYCERCGAELAAL